MLVTDGGESWDIKWDFAYQCKSDKWLNHKRHSPSRNNPLCSIDESEEKKLFSIQTYMYFALF